MYTYVHNIFREPEKQIAERKVREGGVLPATHTSKLGIILGKAGICFLTETIYLFKTKCKHTSNREIINEHISDS